MHLRHHSTKRFTFTCHKKTLARTTSSNHKARLHTQPTTSAHSLVHPWLGGERVPDNYWEDGTNRRNYFDWLGKKLDIKQWSDWYGVTVSQVNNNGGSFLVCNFTVKLTKQIKEYYNSNITQALLDTYPNHPWLIWKFRSVPQTYWDVLDNQRTFMDWVGTQLNIKNYDDWYKVPYSQVLRLGRKLVASKYNNSVYHALCAIYPEHDWQPWKFQHMPRNFWEDTHVGRYLDYIAQQYSITSLDDWLAFPAQHFPKKKLLRRFGGLLPMLAKFHPQFQHLKLGPSKDLSYHSYKHLLGNTSKAQLMLHKHIKTLFPLQPILLNYRHPSLLFPNTEPMELDIYLPKLGVALEYQGSQHFSWTYLTGSPSAIQERDKMKRDACQNAGITLVDIPFWWNTQLASLLATLLQQKPDLQNYIPPELLEQAAHSVPIASTPPRRKARVQ